MNRAPVNRELIEWSTPWLRLALGLAFVAYSANATVAFAADDLKTYFGAGQLVTIGLVEDRFWYALAFATIIFIGELVTSRRVIGPYMAFLLPDVFYTTRQIQAGFMKALHILMGATPTAQVGALLLSWFISIAIGVVIARWGEVLILGRHKRTARKEKE